MRRGFSQMSFQLGEGLLDINISGLTARNSFIDGRSSSSSPACA
jgi:hypothetical protein